MHRGLRRLLATPHLEGIAHALGFARPHVLLSQRRVQRRQGLGLRFEVGLDELELPLTIRQQRFLIYGHLVLEIIGLSARLESQRS